MTPNDLNDGEAPFPEFHSAYMDPGFTHYEKTGEYRDCTVMIEELIDVETSRPRRRPGPRALIMPLDEIMKTKARTLAEPPLISDPRIRRPTPAVSKPDRDRAWPYPGPIGSNSPSSETRSRSELYGSV